LSPAPNLSVAPLFDQDTDQPFVPTRVCATAIHSSGQERLLGRRVSASPLTAASATASLRTLGKLVCIMAIFVSLMLLSGAAHAERAVPNAQKAPAPPTNPFAVFVTEASRRFAVPEHWIRAVMRVESGANARARSRKGAIGLMQIMPETWTELRARYGLGADPYDPRDNVLAGVAYIRELYDRYGAPGFLAAYNAGPRRYENHLATGRSLPDETQAYVATLAPMIGGKQISSKIVTLPKSLTLARSPLFVELTASISSAKRSSPSVRLDRPSSIHGVVDLSALVPLSGNLFVRRANDIRSQ
jgi:hypothetical protein